MHETGIGLERGAPGMRQEQLAKNRSGGNTTDIPHIVIMDVDAGACPVHGCDQLPRLLRTVFAATAWDIQTMTRVPTGPLSPQPDLFFLRSSRTQSLAALVQCFRDGGFAAPLVGLCC